MMSSSPIEVLLRRDRAIVIGALLALTALAWTYLQWLAVSTTPDMPGMVMEPAAHSWGLSEFLVAFAMWAVMMIGMMTPSAAPMILVYERVGRQATEHGKSLAPTLWFLLGYLAAWGGFALVAAVAQAGLLQLRLLTPMLASASNIFAGVVLFAAGLYQWTPVKDRCLSQCQSPIGFIMRYGGFGRSARASLVLGLRHGLYCVGCCWALMAILFVVGVMNLAWIAALSIWVLLEKVIVTGRLMSRALGLVLIVAGLIFIGTGL